MRTGRRKFAACERFQGSARGCEPINEENDCERFLGIREEAKPDETCDNTDVKCSQRKGKMR